MSKIRSNMGIAFNPLSKIRPSQCSLSSQYLPCQRYGNNIVVGPERWLCNESLNGLLCQVRKIIEGTSLDMILQSSGCCLVRLGCPLLQVLTLLVDPSSPPSSWRHPWCWPALACEQAFAKIRRWEIIMKKKIYVYSSPYWLIPLLLPPLGGTLGVGLHWLVNRHLPKIEDGR